MKAEPRIADGFDPPPEAAEFWQQCAQGRLMIKACQACGEKHFYPRPHCPFCLSDQTRWLQAAGTGAIHSYSVMRRAAPPYAIAYVRLDEGVTLMTNIVDCDLDAIRIGQQVRLVWSTSSTGMNVPMFTPI